MNNLILGSAFRAIVMIGGTYLSAKGIATQGEVSNAADIAVQVVSQGAALAAAGYSIWTRFTAQQVKMTNSLPKVVSPAVAKK